MEGEKQESIKPDQRKPHIIKQDIEGEFRVPDIRTIEDLDCLTIRICGSHLRICLPNLPLDALVIRRQAGAVTSDEETSNRTALTVRSSSECGDDGLFFRPFGPGHAVSWQGGDVNATYSN